MIRAATSNSVRLLLGTTASLSSQLSEFSRRDLVLRDVLLEGSVLILALDDACTLLTVGTGGTLGISPSSAVLCDEESGCATDMLGPASDTLFVSCLELDADFDLMETVLVPGSGRRGMRCIS